MARSNGFIVDQTLSDDEGDPLAAMYLMQHPDADTEKRRYLASDPRDKSSDQVLIRPTPEQAFVFPTRAAAAEAVAIIVRLELENFGAHVTWRIEEQAAVAKAA